MSNNGKSKSRKQYATTATLSNINNSSTNSGTINSGAKDKIKGKRQIVNGYAYANANPIASNPSASLTEAIERKFQQVSENTQNSIKNKVGRNSPLKKLV